MNLTRQEKQERRRQMLRIIGDRSVEELSDQELKSVQEIAETIGADTMDQSKYLRIFGQSLNDILLFLDMANYLVSNLMKHLILLMNGFRRQLLEWKFIS